MIALWAVPFAHGCHDQQIYRIPQLSHCAAAVQIASRRRCKSIMNDSACCRQRQAPECGTSNNKQAWISSRCVYTGQLNMAATGAAVCWRLAAALRLLLMTAVVGMLMVTPLAAGQCEFCWRSLIAQDGSVLQAFPALQRSSVNCMLGPVVIDLIC